MTNKNVLYFISDELNSHRALTHSLTILRYILHATIIDEGFNKCF